MSRNLSLEEKYKKIIEVLGGQVTFYIEEIQAIFPDMKKSSVYWNMSKLVDEGYFKRIRNGIYAVNEWKGKRAIALSDSAEKIRSILDETGFEYYISGLDILHKYMQHVPEKYPIIVFIDRNAKEAIEEVLIEKGFNVAEPLQIKKIQEKNIFNNANEDLVVLYQTENFEYSEDCLATTEKAFIDLFFAVTRNDYPVALQELVRIYENITRLGNLDKKKMISAATKRSLQYDIRFIVESKYITPQAMKFVEILRKEE